MNKAIYIAQNNNDTFNFNIPAFDTGAISTAINTPVSNEVQVEENVPNNSFFFLSIILVIFVVCVILAFLYRKKTQEEPKNYYRNAKKYQRVEPKETVQSYTPEEPREKNSLYRHSSNKKTSLSTPTSINKCIRAFLENTKEN